MGELSSSFPLPCRERNKRRRAPSPNLSLEGRGMKEYPLSLDGRKGGQASSEDLLPLGYGERERVRVRVNLALLIKLQRGRKR